MALTADACFQLWIEERVFLDWIIAEPEYGFAWAGRSPGAWEMPSAVVLTPLDDGPFPSSDKPWEATVGSHGVLFEDEGIYRFGGEISFELADASGENMGKFG